MAQFCERGLSKGGRIPGHIHNHLLNDLRRLYHTHPFEWGALKDELYSPAEYPAVDIKEI